MNGAIPLFPLPAYMARTGTAVEVFRNVVAHGDTREGK